MTKLILLVSTLLGLANLLLVANAQTPEKTCLNAADSTLNYYLTYKPQAPVKGWLLLLTSFGETPEMAAAETDIHQKAAAMGIMTIYASLQEGRQSFYIDSISQASLDALIPQLQQNYQLQKLPFYLGGFSLGGSGAVRYAERAYSNPQLIKPKALFAIDPPLDFERMFLSLEFTVRNSQVAVAKNEADYFIKRMLYEFQTSPQNDRTPYHTHSPLSYSDTANTNIRQLKDCPILFITEPDLQWQMDERNRSLYDLNALDCSLAINTLRLLGNPNATLWLSTGQGYRKRNGQRNPHSWSIMNSEETLKWLLRF
jgi:hypothetical protein